MADLHPALIRANIALFTGDYAEVRRLLDDYRAAGGGAAEHAPMALWLDAHAQPEPEERLRRLESLLSLVPPDDPYARLARTILTLERPVPVEPPPHRFTLPRLIIMALALVLIIAGVSIILPKPQPPAVADTPPTAAPAVTAAPLPDRSRPLTGVSRVSYAGGILQVIAVEDGAQRIVGTDGAPLTPVPGARFFAVELAFECRIAICQNPPEAALALRLADGSLIAPEGRAFVQNRTALSPVALGITTRGWLTFEIPSIIATAMLNVTAVDAGGAPIILEMPLD